VISRNAVSGGSKALIRGEVLLHSQSFCKPCMFIAKVRKCPRQSARQSGYIELAYTPGSAERLLQRPALQYSCVWTLDIDSSAAGPASQCTLNNFVRRVPLFALNVDDYKPKVQTSGVLSGARFTNLLEIGRYAWRGWRSRA